MPLCPKMGDKGPRIRLWLNPPLLAPQELGRLDVQCPREATRNPIQWTAASGCS